MQVLYMIHVVLASFCIKIKHIGMSAHNGQLCVCAA